MALNYNYTCRECDHSFDEYLSMDDRKLPESKPCPNCGAEGTVYQSFKKLNMVHEPGSRLKVDDGFREVQAKIAQTHKLHNMKGH